MFKLTPVLSKKIWGYELWIASTHPNGKQSDFVSACGGDYPLLVKIIQADDSLSVQVHPDDDEARLLEGEGVRGKTECWYVLSAAPGAKLVYGLNKPYKTEELTAAINGGRLEEKLQYVQVHQGDFIFIPAGTVHAIGAGLRLLEVQQSCDTTYRLYDWNRGRELHIEKGLKVIHNEKLQPVKQFDEEFSCEYFNLEKVDVKGGYSMFARRGGGKPEDWQLLFALSGSGKIKEAGKDAVSFQPEDIFAVAPGDKVVVEGTVSIMRIRVR